MAEVSSKAQGSIELSLEQARDLDVPYVALLHKEMRILPMLKVSVQEDLASSVTTFSSSRSRQA
jgi:transposase-like protein